MRVLLALWHRVKASTLRGAPSRASESSLAIAPTVQVDPGGYAAATTGRTGPQSGITSVQIAGATVATFNGYSAVPTDGVLSEVTGLHAGKGGAASLTTAIKNASSTGYERSVSVQLTPVQTPMAPGEMRARLNSAEVRLADLCGLTPSLAGTDAALRLRLAQEFFFHLIGAVEVLAQIVNERLTLGIPTEDAGIRNVFKSLKRHHSGHSVLQPINLVGQQTRNTKVPSDPYSEEGIVYRALISRHHVTHRHRNPFVFRLGGDNPPASLVIDIRLPAKGNESRIGACEELARMLDVVTKVCEDGLSALEGR